MRYKRGCEDKKGGESIEKGKILFGKYRLDRILGKGRSGTVYLARHLELDEYRAIKEVPKCSLCYEQFKKEALLLKRLRHPGIPIVYDLEEEHNFSYLIEEFLEGDSLYDLIRTKGHLNQDAVIRYGIQICDLVYYLHSAEEFPILYLDLQPRNLLLCHEQIKLLDFEHADTIKRANESENRFGTPGYCAPEQQGREELGVYTDIYQIGAVLAYLSIGHTWQGDRQELTGQLGRIIRRCLRTDRRERYPSVLELKQELEHLYTKTEKLKKDQSTSLIIAFAGVRPGAGATHLAIGLCTYLTKQGCRCLYEEWNLSNAIRHMADNLRKEADSYGIYSIFGLPMKPRYGKAIRLKPCSYPIIIRDYGNDWRQAAEEESLSAYFLTAGGKWWEQDSGAVIPDRLKEKIKILNVTIIYNRMVRGAVKKLPESCSCFRAPYFSDPFQATEETDSFYAMITKDIAGMPKIKKNKGLWESVKTIFGKRKTAALGNHRRS